MKLIIATINSDKLEAVQEALRPLNATAAYIGMIGDLQQLTVESYRGANYCQPRVRTRLEIVVVNDMLLQETVDAIAVAAAIDERGNRGSLFVVPLQAWIQRPGNDAGPETEPQETSFATPVR